MLGSGEIIENKNICDPCFHGEYCLVGRSIFLSNHVKGYVN